LDSSDINYEPKNPNGNSYSNHTFDPNVLVPGTATYNNFQAILAHDAAILAKLNGPAIIDAYGEMNLGGYWNDIHSGATAAQFSAVFVMTHDYFDSRMPKKFLWSYETAGGNQNYTWGFPPAGKVDIVGVHAFAGNGGTLSLNSGEYQALVPLGLPILNGSTGFQDGANNYAIDAPNFSQNNYTQLGLPMTVKYPLIIGMISWAQSSSLNRQNGALQLLSGNWLACSDLPKGITLAK
jgi:hypothetical protein